MPDAKLKRLKEIEAQQKKLEKEKAALVPKVAAMNPPTYPIPAQGIEKFRGATYSTWFKAAGAFNARDMGVSPKLLDDEFQEFDLPTVFYSQAITGRVKWFGIVDREYVIADLNDKAPWAGNDFRQIYPVWEYTYRVVESIGGVPVRFYEHRARQPITRRDIKRGWHSY